MRTSLFLLFLLATSPLHILSAQSSPDTVLREAQRHNWYIRAVGVGASLGEGRIREFRPDTLVLISRERIPFTSISGIDRRVNRGGGGIAGGFTGAIILGAMAASFVHGMCESTNCHEIPAALGGAGAGFALGAVVGELVNPAKHAWVKVY